MVDIRKLYVMGDETRFCLMCNNYRPSSENDGMCAKGKVVDTDVVCGVVTTQSCYAMRDDESACGKAGRLWEQRSILRALFDVVRSFFLPRPHRIESSVKINYDNIPRDAARILRAVSAETTAEMEGLSLRFYDGKFSASKYPLLAMEVGDQVVCDPKDYVGSNDSESLNVLLRRLNATRCNIRNRFPERRFKIRKVASTDGGRVIMVTRVA